MRSNKDSERFWCPYEGCQRSFAELWRLKVHHRARPDVRGSGKERGHGCELSACPKCGKALTPGKHHVRCGSRASNPAQPKPPRGTAVRISSRPAEADPPWTQERPRRGQKRKARFSPDEEDTDVTESGAHFIEDEEGAWTEEEAAQGDEEDGEEEEEEEGLMQMPSWGHLSRPRTGPQGAPGGAHASMRLRPHSAPAHSLQQQPRQPRQRQRSLLYGRGGPVPALFKAADAATTAAVKAESADSHEQLQKRNLAVLLSAAFGSGLGEGASPRRPLEGCPRLPHWATPGAGAGAAAAAAAGGAGHVGFSLCTPAQQLQLRLKGEGQPLGCALHSPEEEGPGTHANNSSAEPTLTGAAGWRPSPGPPCPGPLSAALAAAAALQRGSLSQEEQSAARGVLGQQLRDSSSSRGGSGEARGGGGGGSSGSPQGSPAGDESPPRLRPAASLPEQEMLQQGFMWGPRDSPPSSGQSASGVGGGRDSLYHHDRAAAAAGPLGGCAKAASVKAPRGGGGLLRQGHGSPMTPGGKEAARTLRGMLTGRGAESPLCMV